MTAPESAYPSDPVPASDPGRRRDLLRLLRNAGEPRSVADLAAVLDVHPNTVRHHLDALMAAGRVERLDVQTGRPGRPAQAYRLVPMMDPDGVRQDRVLAQILAAQVARLPDPIGEAEAAGFAWGQALPLVSTPEPERAAQGLTELLGDLGFNPTVDLERGRVELHHCPFLEAVKGQPAVVCSVHLGLIRGVLQARQAPFTADRLEPFAQPDLCLVHLGKITAS